MGEDAQELKFLILQIIQFEVNQTLFSSSILKMGEERIELSTPTSSA